jgi:hypothetical protein
MHSNDETAHGFALRTLNESLAGINAQAQPSGVQKLLAGFKADLDAALAASNQLDADLAELASNRDLLPPTGYERLEREARVEAAEKSKAALHGARQKLEAIRRAGLLGSQPTIDPAREQLGRAEFDTLIGTAADPAQLEMRVAQLADRGSRDALSILNSPYGRAVLESKGLEGRTLDETLASARLAVAQSATDNSLRHTESELTAAQLLKSAGDLEGAVIASSFALSTQNITA